MEQLLIDVRDIDTEWFVGVRAFFDRALERYPFPAESITRLGEACLDDGTYLLLDGQVIAEPDELDTLEGVLPVWSVPAGQLITRQSAARVPGT